MCNAKVIPDWKILMGYLPVKCIKWVRNQDDLNDNKVMHRKLIYIYTYIYIASIFSLFDIIHFLRICIYGEILKLSLVIYMLIILYLGFCAVYFLVYLDNGLLLFFHLLPYCRHGINLLNLS